MGDWLTIYTLVAFLLGVALSAAVKRLGGRAKSAVAA